LGVSTTTHDREGEITSRSNVKLLRKDIEAAIPQFVGRIDQVPPAYSAIKVQGKRLYALARQGITVQVPSRPVDVYRLDVLEWAPPFLTLEVECGAGTYIRALARDLGQTLGCGAHLNALRRTKSGQFTVERAMTLTELTRASRAGDIRSHLHPLDAALAHLPALCLDARSAHRLALGQAVPVDAGDEDSAPWPEQARAYAPGGRFVALVSRDQAARAWRPRKVFVRPQDILPPADG
jgi:tRNA pseudouridine55 synthase